MENRSKEIRKLQQFKSSRGEGRKSFEHRLGAIHKRRPQNFANFWPPSLGRPQGKIYTQSQDFSKSAQIDPFLDVICMIWTFCHQLMFFYSMQFHTLFSTECGRPPLLDLPSPLCPHVSFFPWPPSPLLADVFYGWPLTLADTWLWTLKHGRKRDNIS